MSVWLWSGTIGLGFGLFAFFVALAPILVWQYRRYGALNVRRLLGAAMVSLYLAGLMSYTWLPLPDRSQAWCDAHAVKHIQWVPFSFVGDIIAAVHKHGLVPALTGPVVLQVVFNVVLFLPWGVIGRRYLHRSVMAVTVSGFFGSLLIETTQATGLWFVYPCAYRLADVDDLIANTTGAFLGAVLAPLVLWWMPRTSTLVARRGVPAPVTSVRRWASMLITGAALTMVSAVLEIVGRFVLLALDADLDGPAARWVSVISLLVAWVLVFVVPAVRGQGTLGQYAVYLEPVLARDATAGDGGPKGSLARRLARMSVVGVPVLLEYLFDNGLVSAIGGLVVTASVLMVPFTRDHRSLSFWLTGYDIRDSRTPRAGIETLDESEGVEAAGGQSLPGTAVSE